MDGWKEKEWEYLKIQKKADRKDMARYLSELQKAVIQALANEKAEYGDVEERNEIAMQRWLQGIITEVKAIPPNHHEALIKQYLDAAYRYGPVQKLWDNPNVTDVQICMPRSPGEEQIIGYTEGGKRRLFKDAGFQDYDDLREWVNTHLSRIGLNYDPAKVTLDGMLPGGERINIVSGSSGYSIYNRLDGKYQFVRCMIVSIRRFPRSYSLEDLTSTALSQHDPIKIHSLADDLVEYDRRPLYTPHEDGLADEASNDYLRIAGVLRKNYLIGGPTGSAKTTYMNAITVTITENEILLVIEERPEVQPQCENYVIRLYERDGVFTQKEALKTALRMFPTRIMVSEIRDDIAYLFMMALISGHEGSGSNIHSTSCKAAFDRLVELACGHSSAPPRETVHRLMSEHLGFIIQMGSDPTSKHLEELCEVNDDGTLHTVTRYHEGKDENGRRKAYFEFLGPSEAFLKDMRKAGLSIPVSWKWRKASK